MKITYGHIIKLFDRNPYWLLHYTKDQLHAYKEYCSLGPPYVSQPYNSDIFPLHYRKCFNNSSNLNGGPYCQL